MALKSLIWGYFNAYNPGFNCPFPEHAHGLTNFVCIANMSQVVDELIDKLALRGLNLATGNRKSLDKWIKASEFIKRRKALDYDCAPNRKKSSVVACMTGKRPKFSQDPGLLSTKELRKMLIGWLESVGIQNVEQLRSLDAKSVAKFEKKYRWQVLLHPCRVLEEMGEEKSESKKGGTKFEPPKKKMKFGDLGIKREPSDLQMGEALEYSELPRMQGEVMEQKEDPSRAPKPARIDLTVSARKEDEEEDEKKEEPDDRKRPTVGGEICEECEAKIEDVDDFTAVCDIKAKAACPKSLQRQIDRYVFQADVTKAKNCLLGQKILEMQLQKKAWATFEDTRYGDFLRNVSGKDVKKMTKDLKKKKIWNVPDLIRLQTLGTLHHQTHLNTKMWNESYGRWTNPTALK